LSTREQQDAHELFLVLAEAISDEAVKVAAEVAITRGFGEILSLQGYIVNKENMSSSVSTSSTTSTTTGTVGTVESGRLGQDGGRGTRAKKRGLAMPWEGLMARRRVCKRCGWCESIRMDTLGGMELAIPLSVSRSFAKEEIQV
jgi:ubiquitin carboxyl-terminal hydrolase 1